MAARAEGSWAKTSPTRCFSKWSRFVNPWILFLTWRNLMLKFLFPFTHFTNWSLCVQKTTTKRQWNFTFDPIGPDVCLQPTGLFLGAWVQEDWHARLEVSVKPCGWLENEKGGRVKQNKLNQKYFERKAWNNPAAMVFKNDCFKLSYESLSSFFNKFST